MATEEYVRDGGISGWRGTMGDVAALFSRVMEELEGGRTTITITEASGRKREFPNAGALLAASADLDAATVTAIEIHAARNHVIDGTVLPALRDYMIALAMSVNRGGPWATGLSLRAGSPSASRAAGMLAVMEEEARKRVDPTYGARRGRFRRSPEQRAAFVLVNQNSEPPAGPTVKQRVLDGLIAQGPTAILAAIVGGLVVLAVQHLA